jgi:hypothetical protein
VPVKDKLLELSKRFNVNIKKKSQIKNRNHEVILNDSVIGNSSLFYNYKKGKLFTNFELEE